MKSKLILAVLMLLAASFLFSMAGSVYAESDKMPQVTLAPKKIKAAKKDYPIIDYDKALYTTMSNYFECSMEAVIFEITSRGTESNFYSLRAIISDGEDTGKLIYLTTQVIDGRVLEVGETYVFYGRAFGQVPDASAPSPFIIPWIGVKALETPEWEDEQWSFWPEDAPYSY